MKGRAAAFALGVVIAAIVASGASASAATVWLCRPGLAHNPCLSSMTTTVIDAHGRRTVQHSRPAAHPAIDCFYVYPTVSLQSTYQREPRHRPAGDRGGDRPGLTVLLGVPRVRADVPTAHGAGDLQAGRDHSGRRGNRLRRCAVCVPRLPRPRQPRTRDRVHRPFPGVVDADPAARSRSRRQAGGPQTARLGAAHGRQRHGQARPGDRWRLLPHRGVSRRDADRMRRRLFKLRRDAAGEQSVRSCRDRDQPVRPPRDGPPDPVRQPGRARRRPRGAAPRTS